MSPLFYLPSLPPVSWLNAVRNSPALVIEGCEHYSKGSWRNRFMIAGPNGPQLLSIPLLKGKHQQKPVREVQIAYDLAWQRQHWRSIATAYGNAPFFEHYAGELQPFFIKKFPFLFDLNEEWLQFFCKKWKWDLQYTVTEQYLPAERMPEGADFRQSWPSSNPKPYPQVFSDRHGFLPDLSALDLLMCCGPRALDYV